MKKIFKKLLITTAILSAVAALTACGGGVGSVSTGGVYFSHDQLAAEFISRAYTDAGVNLTLVKSQTLQSGYIVVDSYQYGTEAVYIDGWTVGTDIRSYMDSQTWWGVTYIGNGFYQDVDGYVYEETAANGKDLAKMTAMKQALDINASAKNIQAQFGLSADRSQVLARLAVQLKNNPKGSMTDADFDAYSKEIVGSTFSEIKSAVTKMAQGDSSSADSLINKAAATNGVSSEQAHKILESLMP